ncbi:MAG: hypothetical protein Q9195_000445 [Heterodermia aff. obscurata]
MVEFIDRFISWRVSLSSLKVAKRTIFPNDSVIAGVRTSSIYDYVEKATKEGGCDVETPATRRDAGTQTESRGADPAGGSKRSKRMSESRRQYKKDYNKRLRASKKAAKAKNEHDDERLHP